MNRLIFEGRFLVNMAGAIIRQDALRPVHASIDWERMFRFADYHRVSNMVYLGMLGNGGKIPERWKESFFERYVQGLTFGENCENAEREILTLIDMYNIPCIILESSRIRNLYQLPEMAYNNCLKILFDEESYTLAKGYLIDQGYETDRFYKGVGERMRHANGFYLEIYHKIPFRTQFYKKNMESLLGYAYVKAPYKHIRSLSLDGQFVFLMAQSVYHYVMDELRIREMLDLYLYYRKWEEQLNYDYIQSMLTAFRIEELAEKFLVLTYMWFGTIEEINPEMRPDNMEPYDVLENRILSRNPTNNESDQQALALAKLIQKEIDKERRKERREERKKNRKEKWDNFVRKVRWVLPEYKYMSTMYPVLRFFPPLLPVFWLMRLLRFLIKTIF